MAKVNQPGKKQPAGSPPLADELKPVPQPAPTAPRPTGKKNSKSGRPQVGGTAVAGAKSTLPKPPPTSNNPQQQQMESYNRTMRRRMQNLGGGDEDSQAKVAQDKRRRRIERRKQRLEERRAELRKSLPNGGKISLGRNTIYFIVAVAALVVLLIVFAILRLNGIL